MTYEQQHLKLELYAHFLFKIANARLGVYFIEVYNLRFHSVFQDYFEMIW